MLLACLKYQKGLVYMLGWMRLVQKQRCGSYFTLVKPTCHHLTAETTLSRGIAYCARLNLMVVVRVVVNGGANTRINNLPK